uniref:Glutamyl-tRNA reductase n=1 Tax=Cyanophora paradoxa TaxID=2762 RepID=HEM1_CYAPA|nr:glutamyl-tRNA reductase [Cyanophora paradoxa]P48077.1 RecName: Full=Glutamyl-tRNA reductase; Short=GluTR [Cyanophora paradoxa]AAA81194.1 glutamyl-tRNA reductase [Cyanophora paradoxa]
MNIIVVGLSHKTAPVDFREKLSIPKVRIGEAIRELCNYPHIEEVAILSTCNRLEIYLLTSDTYQGIREATQFLADSSDLSLPELRQHLFILLHQDAVMHLMRVTAGLDSLIIGEGQILSQVKQCYQLGQQYQGIGPVLNNIFKQAISAGKRVRTETQISTGAVSISSAAVELAQIKKQDLRTANITILGAGKMSRLLVQHLLSKRVKDINIVNRSVERAKLLVDQFKEANINIYNLSELKTILQNSDIVFTGTSSQEPIITPELINDCDNLPSELMLFDIAVPRNVDPNVSQFDNIKVFNVDDLKVVVSQNQQTRRKMAKAAEILLEEELSAFNIWWGSLEAIPTINKLREKAEIIRVKELEKAISRLGNEFVSDHQEIVESLTRGIVNKILHDPMVQLRAQQDIEIRGRALKILQTLFNLDTIKNGMSPTL